MAIKVLFIGGTGIISSACARLAIQAGYELTAVNRGETATRPLPEEAEVITADVRDPESFATALSGREFDVVAQFLAFTPEHVRHDLAQFEGRVGQYVFISSASAYQKPIARLPIVESTPLRNPFWQYSRDKIACEDLLVEAYRQRGFPATIVRPSHTYDRTSVPLLGGWAAVERMRRKEPIVVQGDGTSLWVLTHHRDFAAAFTPLIANPQAIGDSFHITSDQVLSWNQIYSAFAVAAGAEPRLVHVSSERIAELAPDWGPGLLGDKAHSVMFDNSKVRSLAPGWSATIPLARGAEEIVAWHDEDPSRRRADPAAEAALSLLAGA
ncbi:MAG: NAD-dependent dehydratase [Acidimicrobiaceae bacterium]|nr:NAD-dependent dehydratase [Acidimicrobiaceae bacterium]